jgi:thymidylate synthase
LIGNLGDVHLYSNHVEQAKEQIKRTPYELPTLKINSGNENWHLLDVDDIVNSLDNDITFKLENYQSHPTIKAPLSN